MDPFARLAQLLAHLGELILELTCFRGHALEKLVNFVDVVTLETDFEGNRVDNGKGRRVEIRSIHGATLPSTLCQQRVLG